MVTRKRVSNQRQKRPSPHDGRVMCCWDVWTLPSCAGSIADVIARDILVTRTVGVGAPPLFPEPGVYTFGCRFANGATCRMRWLSPDGTDMLQLDGASTIEQATVGLSAATGGCASVSHYTSAGTYSFSSGSPTLENFLCHEAPITISYFGGATVYEFVLLL